MLLNSDFKELLRLFEKYRVRYLIVGGYAVMKYSEPRFTKDVDFWIAVDPENARAVFTALKEFGAPLTDLSAEDFTDRESFYQMGSPPLRVDIWKQDESGRNRILLFLNIGWYSMTNPWDSTVGTALYNETLARTCEIAEKAGYILNTDLARVQKVVGLMTMNTLYPGG